MTEAPTRDMAEFRSLRRSFIGGSDARLIMGTDEAALIRLWREKRGEIEPEDLSGNLIVQLGLATEALNRRWYEANSGHTVTDIQRRLRQQEGHRSSGSDFGDAGRHNQQIAVDDLPPGVYRLRVIAGAGSFVEQFIVVR